MKNKLNYIVCVVMGKPIDLGNVLPTRYCIGYMTMLLKWSKIAIMLACPQGGLYYA